MIVHEIDGGWHIKDLPDGRCIDVIKMLFNWRVVRSTPQHFTYDRGFCYYAAGNGRTWGTSLRIAVAAAAAWDGADDTEPKDYDKRAL